MTGMTENRKSNLFLMAAIVFIALAIIGGIRSYSPVPFWDMWDGYLGFFVKLMTGDTSAWWAQHNEHRIILARCFFWMDFVFFAGQGWFLIIVNYLLQAIVCILFLTILKESQHEKHAWISFFLIAWLFSWTQKENLTWGFQSQFILAQLLPLSALYSLYRSVRIGVNLNKWFVLAVTLGVLSIGSMANGILALPIMTLYAALTRMGLRRVAILGIASAFTLGLYFYGYSAPVGHGSLVQAIRTNPIGLLHYVVVYLGGAFSFGNHRVGMWTASIAGTFFIGSAIFFAFKVLIRPREETLRLALLAFILYIGGTALGTAGGRLIFGIDQALSSRYMTPSLMVWAALLILYLPQINTLRLTIQNKLWIWFAVLVLLMIPKQLEPLVLKKNDNLNRQLAALAIELSVKDEPQIKNIFHSVSFILEMTKKPIAENWSIFGMPPIKDKLEILRTKIDLVNAVDTCRGSINEISKIDGELQYLKLGGWIYDPVQKKVPEYALLIDKVGTVYGVLLIGFERMDVANEIGIKARYSGAKGYLLSEARDKNLQVYVPEIACLANVNIRPQ